jgi:hypothetical protein
MTLRDWRDKNPLRLWRFDRVRSASAPVPQKAVAAEVGVHLMSVWLWERGDPNPKPDHIAALAHLMGLRFAELAGAWHNWTRERPTPQPEEQVMR